MAERCRPSGASEARRKAESSGPFGRQCARCRWRCQQQPAGRTGLQVPCDLNGSRVEHECPVVVVVVLLRRLSLWLCVVLVVCGQVTSLAQLFLAAERPGSDLASPGLVALGWNPSPDTNATGYFLCWGVSSDACTNLLDAGNATNATVAGLAPNVSYYFSVVAYGAAGQESPPSNEIAYSAPAAAITLLVTNVLLSADGNCQALMPDLTGTNYTLAVDTCDSSVVLTQSVAAGTALALGTNQVVLTLTDGCGNAAYATNFVIVQCPTPPVIQTLPPAGGMLTLTWTAFVGQQFQVQYKTNWIQTDWINLGDPFPATNTTMTASDPIGPDPQRFYRVVIVP